MTVIIRIFVLGLYTCVSVCCCVSGHVYSPENDIALLLHLVATDVQWRNGDVIAASIDFIYKGKKGRKGPSDAICRATWAQPGLWLQKNNRTKEKTRSLSTIIYPLAQMHTHIHSSRGPEGHRWLNGAGWEEVFLQLTFSGLRSSCELGQWRSDRTYRVGEKRERFRERDKNPTYEEKCVPCTYVQVEGTLDIDVALVPSSAKS